MKTKDKKLPKSGAMRYGHKSHVSSNKRFWQVLEKSGFFEESVKRMRNNFLKGGD